MDNVDKVIARAASLTQHTNRLAPKVSALIAVVAMLQESMALNQEWSKVAMELTTALTNERKQKVLTRMVEKFRERHGRPPAKIVVAPVALVALGLKKSVSTVWEDIPVECRLFEEDEVASKHVKSQVRFLGVFVKENRGRMRLVACDLKDNKSHCP